MMEIISLTKNDTDLLNDLLLNLFTDPEQADGTATIETLEKLFDSNNTYLLAAVVDHHVVGYALAYRFPSPYSAGHLSYLYDIEVVPEHRKKGIGKLLINTLLKKLKEDNVKELWLGTAIDNVAGQKLFSTTGGERSDEIFTDYTYDLS